jgi:hypothetical protein
MPALFGGSTWVSSQVKQKNIEFIRFLVCGSETYFAYALINLWIRIRIGSVLAYLDPNPGARKLTKIIK